MSLPGGLAFGPDGNLYVSSPGFTTTQPDMILRYNGMTGEFIDTFASGGALNFPQYLAFTPTAAAVVPEPATLILLSAGLAGLVLARRRGRRRPTRSVRGS